MFGVMSPVQFGGRG